MSAVNFMDFLYDSKTETYLRPELNFSGRQLYKSTNSDSKILGEPHKCYDYKFTEMVNYLKNIAIVFGEINKLLCSPDQINQDQGNTNPKKNVEEVTEVSYVVVESLIQESSPIKKIIDTIRAIHFEIRTSLGELDDDLNLKNFDEAKKEMLHIIKK